MTSVSKNTSSTFGAILGTVATTAHSLSRTVNTVTSGLDMIDTYVENAKIRQAATTKVEMAVFQKNLIIDASIEQAERELNLQTRLQGNAPLTKLFNDNYASFEQLFAETAS